MEKLEQDNDNLLINSLRSEKFDITPNDEILIKSVCQKKNELKDKTDSFENMSALYRISKKIQERYPDNYADYAIYHIAIGSSPMLERTKGINLPDAEIDLITNLFDDEIEKY